MISEWCLLLRLSQPMSVAFYLRSGDLTVHPRQLPMYARYSPEPMTEEDDGSLYLNRNTLDWYQHNHLTRALRRQIGGHCFSGFILSAPRWEHVI